MSDLPRVRHPTCKEPDRHDQCPPRHEGGRAAPLRGLRAAARVIRKCAPGPPGTSSNRPPARSARLRAMASPSPVPGAPRVAGGVPAVEPLEDQLLVRRRRRRARRPRRRATTRPSTTPTRSSTPRRGVGRRALSSRLRTSRRSSPASPRTGAGRDPRGVDDRDRGRPRAAPPPRARASSRSTADVGPRGALVVRGGQDQQVVHEALHLGRRAEHLARAARRRRRRPGCASASSSGSRCAASGPCRSWETSATKSRCRCAERLEPAEHPVHGGGQPADLVAPAVVGDPPVELLLGDRVDLGADPVEPAAAPGPAPAR